MFTFGFGYALENTSDAFWCGLYRDQLHVVPAETGVDGHKFRFVSVGVYGDQEDVVLKVAGLPFGMPGLHFLGWSVVMPVAVGEDDQGNGAAGDGAD